MMRHKTRKWYNKLRYLLPMLFVYIFLLVLGLIFALKHMEKSNQIKFENKKNYFRPKFTQLIFEKLS